jgi:hypothetical protein
MTTEMIIFAMVLSHDMGCRRGLAIEKPELSIEQTIATCKKVSDHYAKEIDMLYKEELKKKGKKK